MLEVTVVVENGLRTFELTEVQPNSKLSTRIVIAACRWCRESFIRASKHQTFCSDSCRNTHYRKKPMAD